MRAPARGKPGRGENYDRDDEHQGQPGHRIMVAKVRVLPLTSVTTFLGRSTCGAIVVH